MPACARRPLTYPAHSVVARARMSLWLIKTHHQARSTISLNDLPRLSTLPNPNPASMEERRSRPRKFLSRLCGPVFSSRSAPGSQSHTPVHDAGEDSLSAPGRVVNSDPAPVALSCAENVQDGSAHNVPPVDNGPCAESAAIT